MLCKENSTNWKHYNIYYINYTSKFIRELRKEFVALCESTHDKQIINFI